jgi:PAS domain S-box-containing protein
VNRRRRWPGAGWLVTLAGVAISVLLALLQQTQAQAAAPVPAGAWAHTPAEVLLGGMLLSVLLGLLTQRLGTARAQRPTGPAQHAELLRAMPALVVVVDAQGRLVACSDLWLHRLGHARDGLDPLRPLGDFLAQRESAPVPGAPAAAAGQAATDAQGTQQAISALAALAALPPDGRLDALPVALRHADGATLRWRLSGRRVLPLQGADIVVVFDDRGETEDGSAGVTARAQPAPDPALLLQALALTRSGVAVWDAEDRLVFLSDVAVEQLGEVGAGLQPGCRREDLLRRIYPTRRLNQPDLPAMDDWVRLRMQTFRQPEDLEQRDGEYWRRFARRTRPDGRVVEVATDITELVRARDQLRREREQLDQLLDESPTVVRVVSQSDRRQLKANRAYYERMGLPRQQVDELDLNAYYVNPTQYAQLVSRMAAGESLRGELVEFQLLHAPGVPHLWYQMSFSSIEYDGVPAWLVWATDVTALQQARQELREMLDGVPVALSAWDTELRCELVNPLGAANIGLTPDQMVGRRGPELIDGPAMAEMMPAITQALAGQRVSVEVALTRPDGTPRIIERHLLPRRRGTVVTGFYLAGVDVTHLRQAEARALEREVLLNRILQSAPVSLRVTRRSDGRMLLANLRYAQALHDVDNAADDALNLESLYVDRAQYADIERRLAVGEAVQDELVPLRLSKRPDAALTWVQTTQVQIDYRGEPAVLAWFVNVTELQVARLALQREQALLLSMLNDAPVAVRVGRLADNQTVFANPRYATFVQQPAEQSTGLDVSRYYADPQQFAAIRRRLGAGDTVVDELVELQDPQQPERAHIWALASYKRIHFRGEPAVLAWLYDVTELRQARQRAERAEELMAESLQAAKAASRAKSMFLANTSHEIRTPLNAIIGLGYMLERESLPAAARAQVRRINEASRNLLRQINDVLDLSKIEAGQMEIVEQPFALAPLLDAEMALQVNSRRRSQVRTQLTLAPDLPGVVRGDPVRLRQVLANLLGNALKFTDQGEVTLVVRRGAAQPSTLEFEISDTGIGIDPKAQERLFKPFEQADASTNRRYGGTGLGLSICAELVRLMHGTITVRSAPGEGSCFTVVLPLGEAQPQDLDTQGSAHPIRMLLADDDPVCLEATSALIRALGWQVDTVPGGVALVERALAAAQAGMPHDVLVVDWQMPDLDGLSALAQLRDRLPQQHWPRVVLVSQHDLSALQDDPRRALAAVTLAKPMQAATLFNAIKSSLMDLPARAEQLLANSLDACDTLLWLDGVHVLVVDDNTLNLDVARRVLEREGAQVVTSSSGSDALNQLRKLGGTLDAMLLDVQMPVMDGLEVARHARQIAKVRDLPIIALSAGVLREEREQALDAGMDDFLGKPLDPRRLIFTLRRLVQQRRGRPIEVRLRPGLEDGDAAAHQRSVLGLASLDESQITEVVAEDRTLLLSMLQRLLDEFLTVCSEPADQLAARMHKLRGASQVVGAMRVATAAARVEHALRAQAQDDAGDALRLLDMELQDLAREARPLLQSEARRIKDSERLQAHVASTAEPASAQDLQALTALVASQNTRAARMVEALGPGLIAVLGPRRARDLRDALANFNFKRAAAVLAETSHD